MRIARILTLVRPSSSCRCSHDRAAHTHYRQGSDCAFCGPATCTKFRGVRVNASTLAPVTQLSPARVDAVHPDIRTAV